MRGELYQIVDYNTSWKAPEHRQEVIDRLQSALQETGLDQRCTGEALEQRIYQISCRRQQYFRRVAIALRKIYETINCVPFDLY